MGLTRLQRREKQVREARHVVELARVAGYFDNASSTVAAEGLAYDLLAGRFHVSISATKTPYVDPYHDVHYEWSFTLRSCRCAAHAPIHKEEAANVFER